MIIIIIMTINANMIMMMVITMMMRESCHLLYRNPMVDVFVLKSSHGNFCAQRSMTLTWYYHYEPIKVDVDDDDKP